MKFVCSGSIAQNVNSSDGNGFITAVIDSVPYTITTSNPAFQQALTAFRAKDWQQFITILTPAKLVEKWGVGKIKVSDGNVYYRGEQVYGLVVDKILEMANTGLDITYMLKFLDKLYKNPSRRAVDELYGFLQGSGFVIDEDGDILGYRNVTTNFRDHHTGKWDNSPGQTCKMERKDVDNDKNRTCSRGLHIASWEYLKHFNAGNSKTILCKINPADVVSVPTDYNNTKMRVCKFYVVREYTESKPLVQSDVLSAKKVCSTPVAAPQKATEAHVKHCSKVVKFDSLGRPLPERGPDGKFLKKNP